MPRSVWKGPFVDGYLLKKAEVHPGFRFRGNGRSQVRRVRADPDLLWPRCGQESEEEVSHG